MDKKKPPTGLAVCSARACSHGNLHEFGDASDLILFFLGQPKEVEGLPSLTSGHGHTTPLFLLVVVTTDHATRLGLVVLEVPLAGVVVLVVAAVALESERTVSLEVIPAEAPLASFPSDRLVGDEGADLGFRQHHLCHGIAVGRNGLDTRFLRESGRADEAQERDGERCKESFACRLTLHENLLKELFYDSPPKVPYPKCYKRWLYSTLLSVNVKDYKRLRINKITSLLIKMSERTMWI